MRVCAQEERERENIGQERERGGRKGLLGESLDDGLSEVGRLARSSHVGSADLRGRTKGQHVAKEAKFFSRTLPSAMTW